MSGAAGWWSLLGNLHLLIAQQTSLASLCCVKVTKNLVVKVSSYALCHRPRGQKRGRVLSSGSHTVRLKKRICFQLMHVVGGINFFHGRKSEGLIYYIYNIYV